MIVIRNALIVCLIIVFSFVKAGEQRDVLRQSNVKEIYSGLGVKLWFMKDDSTELVHVKIAFKNSGSSYQVESKTGVPTFYSHAVFCGTGKFTEVEFKQKCSDISVKISCRAGVDNLFFSMTAPRIVLKEAIELFGMLMGSPTFEKDKVRKIQNEIGYSMQNYAITPVEIAFYTLAPALIFPSHVYKYGLHGNSEHFMKLSIDDLVKYKKKFLVIKNAEACICGNIDENEAVSLLNNVLRGIEKGEPAQDNIPDISPQLTPKITKYYVEGPQSVVIFILKNEKPLSSQKPAISILYRIL
jgi:predicted Zn-dependent peptidase